MNTLRNDISDKISIEKLKTAVNNTKIDSVLSEFLLDLINNYF